jgi:hypothetical protein
MAIRRLRYLGGDLFLKDTAECSKVIRDCDEGVGATNNVATKTSHEATDRFCVLRRDGNVVDYHQAVDGDR